MSKAMWMYRNSQPEVSTAALENGVRHGRVGSNKWGEHAHTLGAGGDTAVQRGFQSGSANISRFETSCQHAAGI